MTFLTAILDPDDIESALNTGWNAGVIAKPDFKQTYIGERANDPNEILINWGSIDLDAIDVGYTIDSVRNTIEIWAVALNKTDGLKMVSETRRIINAMTPTQGKIHITNIVPATIAGNNSSFLCIATQEIEGLGD